MTLLTSFLYTNQLLLCIENSDKSQMIVLDCAQIIQQFFSVILIVAGTLINVVLNCYYLHSENI